MKSIACKFCGYIIVVAHEPVGDEHALCPQCGASYEADKDNSFKLDVADEAAGRGETGSGGEKKFRFRTDGK